MRRTATVALCLGLAWAGLAGAAEPEVLIEDGFATGVVCALCHSNTPRASAMRDAASSGVAPYDLWRGSMMAHAARDPFWRAVVAAEIDATPSRGAEIRATCNRCHSPMGGAGDPAGAGDLALDGVSCVVCHRIRSDGLGEEASYTGGFVLDGEARIFGPHEAPFPMPMRMHTGFTPTHGAWTLESALCGSCHTVLTEAYEADGTATGRVLPEQATWLEWRHSGYAGDDGAGGDGALGCRHCHLPLDDDDGRAIATRIARNPGGFDFPMIERREPYGRHLLVGGNTLVPRLLARGGDGLAPAEVLERTADRTGAQLADRAAQAIVERAERGADGLHVAVRLVNLAGHKLPSGQPARRAWLRLTVRAGERVLFDSGGWDAEGRLVDGRGAVLPIELRGGPVAPHRATIVADDEVALFESVMADGAGRPTWRLMRGVEFLKDDRLLPRGWREEPSPRIAPRGVDGDDDFGPGGDVVAYRVTLPDDAAEVALRVEARLVYQPIGARFLAELLAVDAPEVRELATRLRPGDLQPLAVADAAADVPAAVHARLR